MSNDPSTTQDDRDALEHFIADNDDLLDLEARVGRFNIFDALGVTRAEIRHSNFLAWLLDPSASHGQGDLFLKAVVTDILRKARAQGIPPIASPIDIDGCDLYDAEVHRERQHIDLLVVCRKPAFLIVVENKVDSGEHSNQLQRYEDSVRAEFPSTKAQFVFLTVEGEDASDRDWVTYSYEDLHGVLTRVRRQAIGSLGGDVGAFLGHYLNLIETRLMEDKEIVALCRRIRANHGRALDLIYKHTGGEAEPLLHAFAERVRTQFPDLEVKADTSRDVRLIPRSWLKVLPAIREGEEPCAWLSIRFVVKQQRCWFAVRASRVTDTPRRNAIIDGLLSPDAGLDFKPSFKSWKNQKRVLLAVHKITSWSEDDEPDIADTVDKAVSMLSGLLAKLKSVPEIISTAESGTP